MNKLLFLVFWFCSFSVISQVVSIPSNQKAKDLVYDSITNKIYITIPTSDVVNGNSIGIVNPNTNILESTLFVGDNPVEIAISDNGQYIYVAFDGVAKIRRYTLNPLAFDMEFGLGIDPPPSSHGNFYARDIAVMPGQPNTIAVSRKVIDNVSPDHAGIAIYDNGIMRPTTYYSDFTIGITKVKFKDASTLIGHAGTSSSAGTTLFNINGTGISFISNHPNIPNPHPYVDTSDFIYRQNKLYFMNGRRVDISSTPILDGQYTPSLFAGSGVMYDELNNLVCFIDSRGANIFFQGGFWNGYLTRYNPTSLQLFDTYRITTQGSVDKMISCGDNCYALITNTVSTNGSNRVVILKPQVLSNEEFDFKNNFSLYPNPTHNIFYIKNLNNINILNVSIYNTLGEVIWHQSTNNNGIDLSSISNGIYFCKITDDNGKAYTQKIIKE